MLCFHAVGFIYSPTFQVVDCYFDGGIRLTEVYNFIDLCFGHTIKGPAIIADKNR